ncbi:MAG: WbqC family protein, partial [Bacteroidota bacterium]|nr:WbqC family protein [Bacteroidota bacterium]
KLAIMQPYIFPYIGYFQLMSAVDLFIFYDDVNFIKQGWINRNDLLMQGKGHQFVVPLEDASSFKQIREVRLSGHAFVIWRSKFLRTMAQSYGKAPEFINVKALVEQVLHSPAVTIADLAIESLLAVHAYLDLSCKVVKASESFPRDRAHGQERVLEICMKAGATTYINAIGGMELYDQASFKQKGVELAFLKPMPRAYSQFQHPFVPWLSIIDVLMFNDKAKVKEMLATYQLVKDEQRAEG